MYNLNAIAVGSSAASPARTPRPTRPILAPPVSRPRDGRLVDGIIAHPRSYMRVIREHLLRGAMREWWDSHARSTAVVESMIAVRVPASSSGLSRLRRGEEVARLGIGAGYARAERRGSS
jgi:hypothetical protein